MDLENPAKFSRGRFITTVVVLAIHITALAVILAMAASLLGDKNPDTLRRTAGKIAWLAASIISFDAILLLLSLSRFLRSRLTSNSSSKPTEYVDAWAEAGARVKLEDDEDSDQ